MNDKTENQHSEQPTDFKSNINSYFSLGLFFISFLFALGIIIFEIVTVHGERSELIDKWQQTYDDDISNLSDKVDKLEDRVDDLEDEVKKLKNQSSQPSN